MIRLRFHVKAFREIRTSPGVMQDIEERCQAVADACGEGYEYDMSEPARNRARGVVRPATSAAVTDNARNNTLLRGLEAGR